MTKQITATAILQNHQYQCWGLLTLTFATSFCFFCQVVISFSSDVLWQRYLNWCFEMVSELSAFSASAAAEKCLCEFARRAKCSPTGLIMPPKQNSWINTNKKTAKTEHTHRRAMSLFCVHTQRATVRLDWNLRKATSRRLDQTFTWHVCPYFK